MWVACGINHEGILVPGSTGFPGQYGGVELLVSIFHRSQSQSVSQCKPSLSLIVPKQNSRKDSAIQKPKYQRSQ